LSVFSGSHLRQRFRPTSASWPTVTIAWGGASWPVSVLGQLGLVTTDRHASNLRSIRDSTIEEWKFIVKIVWVRRSGCYFPLERTITGNIHATELFDLPNIP